MVPLCKKKQFPSVSDIWHLASTDMQRFGYFTSNFDDYPATMAHEPRASSLCAQGRTASKVRKELPCYSPRRTPTLCEDFSATSGHDSQSQRRKEG